MERLKQGQNNLSFYNISVLPPFVVDICQHSSWKMYPTKTNPVDLHVHIIEECEKIQPSFISRSASLCCNPQATKLE